MIGKACFTRTPTKERHHASLRTLLFYLLHCMFPLYPIANQSGHADVFGPVRLAGNRIIVLRAQKS
jgi:hypothetical protein